MAYAICEFDATDDEGNLLLNVEVEVRREADGLQVVYSDRDGAISLGSTFTVADGHVKFFATGGAYRITLTSGDYSRVLRYKAIGLAAESDYTLISFQGVWEDDVTYVQGDYVVHEDVGIFVSTGDANLNNEPDAATPGSTANWVYYPGVAGTNSYTYVAYASDDAGTDFTTTFDAALDYIAIRSSLVEIDPLQASDFAGLWKRYKGDKGWSPTFDVVADGARRVLQLTGYVGGEGTEPTDNVGEYVSDAGYTPTIGDAIDVRGPAGATGAGGAVYDSVSDAEADDTLPTAPEAITTNGYATAGDGGGALYKKVASEPSHAGKFSITLSDAVTVVWYELAEIHVHAKMLGLVGDGSDEAAGLNSLFALGKNGSATLEYNKTYGYDPSVGIEIVGPVRIQTNGSSFVETTANTEYAVTLSGNGIEADRLAFDFVGADTDRYNEKGITVNGDYHNIGSIRLTAANSRTGANGSTYNAIVVGPEAGTLSKGVRIGCIETANWDRPVFLQRLEDWWVGRIECDTYRRAVYIKDCIDGEIASGQTSTTSPSATGKAGDNSILIEAVEDHFSTRNIRVSNFDSRDSGEHGFRIGGQKSVRGIWHVNCSAKNSGSGYGTGTEPDDHGGCGFKCLGPTGVYGDRHEEIYYVNCTVENAITDDDRINFSGFQMGKIIGGGLINPIVRPSVSDYTYGDQSCGNGIELLGVEDFAITNPIIKKARLSSIYIYDADDSVYDWGITINVKIVGGISDSPGIAAVEVVANFTTFRRISVTGLLCNNGLYALKAAVSGDGAYIGCTFDGETWSVDTELFNGADAWLITGKGQWSGTTNACRNGSSFNDWSAGTFKVMKAGAWTAL